VPPQPNDLLGADGRAEEVALAQRAPEVEQEAALGVGLDPLRQNIPADSL